MARAIPIALALLASACTVGPTYQPPAPSAPAAFTGPQSPATAAPAVDLARWWEAFGDAELTRLIAIGLRQAPDLQTAESRVREARLGIVQAQAAGLPTLSAAGNTQAETIKTFGGNHIAGLIDKLGFSGDGSGGSGGAGGAFAGGDPPIPLEYHTVSAGFDASWEIDLFGGVRRQLEAARAQAQAAEWNARDARVRLAAEIANDYLAMRGDQAQADIARGEVDRQARALGILQHTAQVGLVPQGNAIRQRTQLAQARARVAPLDAQAFMQMHALAVLVGEAPETLIEELRIARPLAPMPPEVPPGLPVDLIRRRPDVRAAERQLAAASADIGVAVADLYPRITLSAMPQLAATWLGGFFIGKSFQLSASGAASFPVFDGGRRRAQVDIRREQREQAYIAWRQAVLGALRDVEDALVRIASEKDANAALRDGVADATRSLATVQAQFDVGLLDYTPVLDGQQTVLQARDSLAQSDVRLRQDIAALYKALGGGWAEDDAPPLRPVIEDAPKKRGEGSR